MRRGTIAGLTIAVALIPASAAAQGPGDFPEQPGDHVSTACGAVISHGQGGAHESDTASAIINSLYTDACPSG